MAKFCTNCGAKLHEDSVFCEVCGTRVVQAVQPQGSANGYSQPQGPANGYSQPQAPANGYSQQRPAGYDMSGYNDAPYGGINAGRKSGAIALAAVCGASILMVLAVAAFMFGCNGKGDPSSTGKTVTESISGGKNQSGKNSPYFQLKEENTQEKTEESKGTQYADIFVQTDAADEVEDTEAFEETEPAAEGFGAQAVKGSANGREIAQKLSTSENARATDFEWLLDYILYDGSEAGQVITDSSYSSRIIDDSAALNGGWKAYMFTDDGVYGSDVERYFNVEIDTDGSRFNMTVNWKYMFDPSSGSSIDETGSDRFEGSYAAGTATCRSNYAKIDIDEFYLSKDGETEYAVGTFYWISGEVDRIGLMRSAR